MGTLDGKVALVTGGARGIGAATSLELAREGADVAIVDILPVDESNGVVEQVVELGQRAIAVQADVAVVAEIRRAVSEVMAGLGKLDILVNNAGGPLGEYTAFEDVSEDAYERVVTANLKSVFFVSQAAVPYLRRSDAARIVNISTDLAYVGWDMAAAYVAAKAGVMALTRSMARALAPGIRVNTVAPGPTATEQFSIDGWNVPQKLEHIPLGRLAEPLDVARTVAFLCGPGGDHYTGQTLDPNGGAVMP